MLPESVFEMPFGIKILPNICLIRTVSAKACLLDLPRGWGFRAFSHKMMALDGVVLQQIFPFCPFKNSPGVVSLECKFFFIKKPLYKKLALNFLFKYNRNTIDYCSHNN